MNTAVRRGDIRNEEYAFKAKTYSWGTISRCFPGGISPTDIDGTVEINGYFLAVEFKTIGTRIGRGQSLYFEQYIYALKNKAILFILEHDRLASIDVASEIKRMSVWWWEPLLSAVAKLNFFDANEATLSQWCHEWVLQARGNPNDITRSLREKLGIYPPSCTEPSAKVGGECCRPPYRVAVSSDQVDFF